MSPAACIPARRLLIIGVAPLDLLLRPPGIDSARSAAS